MRIYKIKPPTFPMRRLLILAPLGMLLLPSCEPGEDNADAGKNRPHEHLEKSGEERPRNETSHEQLAAQESLGRPPLPRNLIAATEDTCPVHHERMKIREIPIVFEESAEDGTGPGNPTATAAFPFGAEKIVSAGNALLPGEALTARVYQCASCIAARRAIERMRGNAALREGSK